MGRELKRVPLDFDWPINKLWSGYINPHPVHECKSCGGDGMSEEYRELYGKWYAWENPQFRQNPFKEGFRYNINAWSNNLTREDVAALIKANRLWDFTRVPLNEEHRKIIKKEGSAWLPFNNGYIPTPKEVNEWNLKGIGHDSSNAWICIKARLKREGKPYRCPKCNGTGENWQHLKAKRLYKNWKDYDPPTGEGYQLWTTTSEGSPMTPVFPTLEALCEYCEKENVSVFGDNTATKEEWKKMLDDRLVYHKTGNVIFI